MSTKDELLNKIKKMRTAIVGGAVAISSVSVSEASAQNQDPPPPLDIKTTIANMNNTVLTDFDDTTLKLSPSDFASLSQNISLEEKLNSPVTLDDKVQSTIPSRIGNWSQHFGEKYTTTQKAKDIRKQIKSSPQPQNPHNVIDHNKIVTIDNKDSKMPGALAYVNDTITLVNFSDAEKSIVENKTNNYAEYIKGNPFARLQTFYHELTHFVHSKYDGLTDSLELENSIRGNRLTETTACAVQYLAAAEQYTSLKKQGIQQVDVNGEQKPIEHILDMYPDLKDHIIKNGFDVNNPQSIRSVVELSSSYWHQYRQQRYNETAKMMYLTNGYKEASPKESFASLKYYYQKQEIMYDVISKNMLEDVYIGNNTNVDLTHCRDLLDTMTLNDAHQLCTPPYASPNEVSSIDQHLEEKGLKTDNQKSEFLANFFDNVSNRRHNSDPKLTDLLLSYNNEITYADGITLTSNNNGQYIAQDSKTDAKATISKLPSSNTNTSQNTQSSSNNLASNTR
ncbi:MAG: hypothetical protein IJZ30_04815 [Alphaproteobacteria bacterium]|nr:hypothetical protein [Alphaproteobacteria bacterium]